MSKLISFSEGSKSPIPFAGIPKFFKTNDKVSKKIRKSSAKYVETDSLVMFYNN